jgi:hypothetical protein
MMGDAVILGALIPALICSVVLCISCANALRTNDNKRDAMPLLISTALCVIITSLQLAGLIITIGRIL